MNDKRSAFLLLLLIAIAVAGCSASKPNHVARSVKSTTTIHIDERDVAVIVNGEPILKKDVDAAVNNSKITYKFYNLPRPTRDQLLHGMIWATVMRQEVEKRHIKVSKSELAAYTKVQRGVLAKLPKGQRDRYKRYLQSMGFRSIDAYLSSKQSQDHYRLSLALEKISQKRIDEAVEKEVPPGPFSAYEDKLMKQANIRIFDTATADK